jgi:AAA family ATP:ADP antiporter
MSETRSVERRGPLDSLLNVFSDVHGGEGRTALLLMLNVFLLLTSYYLLKTIREPLILAAKGGGAVVKSYASAGIATLLIGLVPLYGAIASRVSRVRLINGVTAFFILCLVGFFVWARAVGIPGVGGAVEESVAAPDMGKLILGVSFFIWVGIFNLMIIAQFWAFANDVYTIEQGKRLFAIVAFGGSLGAIAGGKAAELLIKSDIGIYPIMAIAAGILVGSMFLTNIVHMSERHRPREATPAAAGEEAKDAQPDADAKVTGRSGFAQVLSDRYLLLIALFMLLLNLVNTTGEYILGQTLTNLAKTMVSEGKLTAEGIGPWIGTFYGSYFFWVNLVAAILQAFFVSRIIKWIGIRGALLVLPIVAFGAYSVLAFIPLLAFVRTAKIAENSLDYSLNNTTRQSLFLPTSREAKYKAKQAIDTFFVRLGDVGSAGLVFVGTTWLALTPSKFALVNAGFVLIWIALAIVIGKAFQKKAGVR